jgi:hypothetical protein
MFKDFSLLINDSVQLDGTAKMTEFEVNVKTASSKNASKQAILE